MLITNRTFNRHFALKEYSRPNRTLHTPYIPHIYILEKPTAESNTMTSTQSSPPLTLAGKVAIVTGSSRGIGAAIALEFAKRGAKVSNSIQTSPLHRLSASRNLSILP